MHCESSEVERVSTLKPPLLSACERVITVADRTFFEPLLGSDIAIDYELLEKDGPDQSGGVD